jgi:competence protein ComEC
MTVLDVGQGQCILLQGDGKSFLVDCGGNSDWNSADTACETLLSQGINRLDGIIVTHYDDDHAGGIPHLLTRIPADAVYLPEIKDDSGVSRAIRNAAGNSAVTVTEDLLIRFGMTHITIYGPESYNLSNESSLCVLFQRENCDILITGDRGSLGEMLLMHRTELPKLDVLVAGHHGSAGSTGDELLCQTEPEYVFISAGRNNRYRHPSEKLLARLNKFGCVVYRTDLCGTIIYRG